MPSGRFFSSACALPARHRCVLLPVLVLGCALLAGCPSQEERSEQARAEAEAALERGQRGAAVEALERLRATQPETPESLLELAQLLVRAGEAPQVVWMLEEGLDRFPERDDLRVALASAALLVNDAVKARQAAELVPASSPEHPAALLVLAQAQLELGDLAASLAVLEDGEKRYPQLSQFRLARITTLLRESRLEEARAALAEERGSADDALRPYLRRFEARLHGAELRAALQAVRDAGSDDTARARATDQARGQMDASLEALERLTREDPSDVALWQALADAYLQTGRADEAVERLEAAMKADPTLFGLLPTLAQLQVARNDVPAAEAALTAFAEKAPSATSALALARFHLGRGQPEKAVQVLAKAVVDFPDVHPLRRQLTEAWLDAGNLDEARAEFGRYRDLDPQAPEVQFLQARIELAEGDPRAAREHLMQVVAPLDDAATQFWLGRALELSGDDEGAMRRYGVSVLRDPSQPAAYRALMLVAERRGAWRDVVSYAEMLVRRNGGDEPGWVALVTGLLQLGDGERAEAVARQARQLFPDDPSLAPLLAQALVDRGRFDEAQAVLDEAEKASGATPETTATRATALAMTGRTGEGMLLLRDALGESPESARLHATLAALLYQRQDAQAGDAEVDRALELAPDDLVPLRMRAEFRLSTHRFREAVADCQRYLASRPDDARILYYLAVGEQGAGHADRAIDAYRQSAARDERFFEPRNNLAELLRARGDLDGALAAAQEAYAIAGDDPYVGDTLGLLYVEKGLVARAIPLLEHAHASLPEHPVVQFHLAYAYSRAERTDEARRLLEELRARGVPDPALAARIEETLRALP